MKTLKKLGHAIAKAFGLARAADEKLSHSIAAALDAKAEQLKEYEKSFEPEPPEPDPILEINKTAAQAGISTEAAAEIATCATALIMTTFNAAAATYALRRFAEALNPKPRSNNWRKMHGLPMRRKMPKQRRR